jgi:hypothetical protein
LGDGGEGVCLSQFLDICLCAVAEDESRSHCHTLTPQRQTPTNTPTPNHHPNPTHKYVQYFPTILIVLLAVFNDGAMIALARDRAAARCVMMRA